MVRLIWVLTGIAALVLWAGAGTEWLHPRSNEYLGMVVGTGVLLGLSLGFAAAVGAAALPGPSWLAFLCCLAVCSGTVWLTIWGAGQLLPPVHVLADLSAWQKVPVERLMTWFLAPTAAVAAIPSFGLWRWWYK